MVVYCSPTRFPTRIGIWIGNEFEFETGNMNLNEIEIEILFVRRSMIGNQIRKGYMSGYSKRKDWGSRSDSNFGSECRFGSDSNSDWGSHLGFDSNSD